jgi:hypothetical protein
MFRTFHLDRVEWVPLGKWMSRVYRVFPWMPEAVMSPPAFVSELMGLTLYLAIDARLQEIFADEPEARDRCRALLREIMTDEMGHVGQRRNYIGPIGLKVSWWMVEPMFRAFYRDIPEGAPALRRRTDDRAGQGVRLRDHAAGRDREELDPVVLQDLTDRFSAYSSLTILIPSLP